MSEKTTAFVKELVARFPGLASLLDAHRQNNADEILPHVFFGDVTRYVVVLADKSAGSELRDIITYLEEAFAGRVGEISNLISVSFLENLPREGERAARIRALLGPLLSAESQAIG